MESLDLRVLADALQWRKDGHAVTLVTVVETWGSAPRPPGALLALRDDGAVSGSVSGGCVEDDLIAQTKAAFHNAPYAPRAWVAERSAQVKEEPAQRAGDTEQNALPPRLAARTNQLPTMLAYGVSKEEAARFGLPCGGTLRLVREPLLNTAWVEELLTRTERNELVTRQLTLATGAVQLSPATRGQALQFDGSVLSSVFGPKWRLLLIGAGQLSQAVAQIAQMLDFEVLVCDPRDEYFSALQSGGVTRVPGMPDDVVRALRPDAHTAIVALTHDPKLDDMALLEALGSDAFYVGALGSRRNQATRKQRLAEHFDLTPEVLARLHGPVGLFIGAKTPAEIAVSVMAEIVQVKNTVFQRLHRTEPDIGMCVSPPTVLILASGRGERFVASGGQGSKLQALLHGKRVLEHTLDAVRASGLPFHVETTPHPGMGDSIAAAVKATEDAAGWLILPGDLPLISSATLLAVASALTQHTVVVPVFQGQRGHPVGFAARCRANLLGLKGNKGAALVFIAYPAIELIVADCGTVTDIDTLDDLHCAARHSPNLLS